MKRVMTFAKFLYIQVLVHTEAAHQTRPLHLYDKKKKEPESILPRSKQGGLHFLHRLNSLSGNHKQLWPGPIVPLQICVEMNARVVVSMGYKSFTSGLKSS